jgi:cell wall-associated NlpC family hydrolase
MDVTTRSFLLQYAWSFIGVQYHWAGDDPLSGFDCGGWVCELLQAVGVLRHGVRLSSQDLYTFLVNNKAKALLQGELGAVCFYGEGEKKITHVGLCISNKLMINAAGGTRETTTKEKASEMNAFIKMRPIAYRKDLFVILLPAF